MSEPAWLPEARELQAAGFNQCAIARIVGVDRSRLRYWIVPGVKEQMLARAREHERTQRAEDPERYAERRRNTYLRQMARQEAAEGKRSYEEACKAFGVRPSAAPAWWARARTLRSRGMTYDAIAAILGKSLAGVYRALNKDANDRYAEREAEYRRPRLKRQRIRAMAREEARLKGRDVAEVYKAWGVSDLPRRRKAA